MAKSKTKAVAKAPVKKAVVAKELPFVILVNNGKHHYCHREDWEKAKELPGYDWELHSVAETEEECIEAIAQWL